MSTDNKHTQAVKKTLDELFSELNRMGGEQDVTDALKQVLGEQHRTLQQNFFRYIIVPAIETFAEKQDNKFTDLRNEASCKLASQLRPLVKNACLPFI